MALASKKILIVEDNQDLCYIYKESFEAAGFEVRVSPQGLDGIVQALEFHPELILLDLMMPQMDGYEVLSAIRKNSSLDVVIVVCSNLGQQADIDRAMELGADHYLSKSDYRPKALVKKINEICLNGQEPLPDAETDSTPPPTTQFTLLDTVLQDFAVSRKEHEPDVSTFWLEEKNNPPIYKGMRTVFAGFLPPKKISTVVQGRPLVFFLQRYSWEVKGEVGSEKSVARTIVTVNNALVIDFDIIEEANE